jgi:nicotinamidase-related amidase
MIERAPPACLSSIRCPAAAKSLMGASRRVRGEVVDQKPGGPDKFLGDDLDQRLKSHGIKTVIVCGTSAQGVGIGTGAAAAQRGYYVIYPVDCLLSESAFREAYAAWHMAGGGPPVTTKWVTVTRSDMITFGNANR